MQLESIENIDWDDLMIINNYLKPTESEGLLRDGKGSQFTERNKFNDTFLKQKGQKNEDNKSIGNIFSISILIPLDFIHELPSRTNKQS